MFATPSHSNTGPATAAARLAPWRVLIVDDDQEVHALTRIALRDCRCQDRGIEFLEASDVRRARELLQCHDDIAIAFIDVVMDTDHAGLDLVTYIRREMRNRSIRLILRTGQPGVAPERQVIRDYDINDYIAKASVSAAKLYTTTVAALRTFDHITSLERDRDALDRVRVGLETVVDASAALGAVDTIESFATQLLKQFGRLLHCTSRTLLVQAAEPLVHGAHAHYDVLAKAGHFKHDADALDDPAVRVPIEEGLKAGRSIVHGGVFIGYFPVRDGLVHLLYVDGAAEDADLPVLEQLSRQICVTFDGLDRERKRRLVLTELILMLCDLIESRSHDSANRTRRVAELAQMLGQAAGLDRTECDTLFLLAVLQWVGPLARLDAAPAPERAPLSSMAAARPRAIDHDQGGRANLGILRLAALVAAQRDERVDGSGTPDGLQGASIHVYSRIITIAQAFDAALGNDEAADGPAVMRAVEVLQEGRGTRFDAELVDAFIAHREEAQAMVRALADTLPAALT